MARRNYEAQSPRLFRDILSCARTFTHALAQNAPAPAAPPQPPQTSFDPLRGNVFVFSGRGGTIGMLLAPDGVVIVDTQFQDTAKIALSTLQQWTTRKIDFLINTHHHGDHTSGNIVFRPVAAKIVAHRNVPMLQKKQAANAKSEDQQAYADTTVRHDLVREDRERNRQPEVLRARHTSGDSVVRFHNANIVHMGDLLFYLRNPRSIALRGASIKNWIVTLEAVAKEHPADTIYVAGHSKINLPITAFARRAPEVPRLLHRPVGVRAEGRGVRQIGSRNRKGGERSGFADYEGSPEGTIQAAYEELTAKG